MAIPVSCTRCGRNFEVGDQLAGQSVSCLCGEAVQVPEVSRLMDFFSQELDIRNRHMIAETPAEWAKATGAPPEVTQEIEKRMAKKLTSNAGFMMAITGAIIAALLIAGLLAFLLAPRRQPAATSALERSCGATPVLLGPGPSIGWRAD
jgi:hypothetical protein